MPAPNRILSPAPSVPSASPATDGTPEFRKRHAKPQAEAENPPKVIQLRAPDAELTEPIERDLCERDEVRGSLADAEAGVRDTLAEAEADEAVLAPVAGGIDPTETLPYELLWMILVQVLVGGSCGRVCRRWHAVCSGATAKKEAWQWRWAGYTHGGMTPRTLTGGITGGSDCLSKSPIRCLATASLQNTVYSGAEDGAIQVWCTVTNTHVRTLPGHTGAVIALAVAEDGALYSASADSTVRIWSGEDGSHLDTLDAHTDFVTSLAFGWDGTVYTGSSDKTVHVWADRAGGSRLIRTLEGHAHVVWSIALGTNGKLYSGSADKTIRVWSADNGSHLGTLEGHTAYVYVVAVAADGTVYSGSRDDTLRAWSGVDGSPIRTLQMDCSVFTIAVGAGNTVLIGDARGRVSAWKGGAAPARTLCTVTPVVTAVAIGQDGRLFVGCYPDFHVHAL
jgi:hypothetical protein